jgi:hypothetical protein
VTQHQFTYPRVVPAAPADRSPAARPKARPPKDARKLVAAGPPDPARGTGRARA